MLLCLSITKNIQLPILKTVRARAMNPDLNPPLQCHWQLSDPPPIRNRCRDPPEEFVPFRVFGYPMSEEDIYAWGAANNIGSDDPPHIRFQLAWNEIKYRLPPGRMRVIYRGGSRHIYCFVIGSNATQKDLARAADIEVINKYQDVLHSKEGPGWFRVVQ